MIIKIRERKTDKSEVDVVKDDPNNKSAADGARAFTLMQFDLDHNRNIVESSEIKEPGWNVVEKENT